MKRTRLFTAIAAGFGLAAGAAAQTPVGTAFTYQGLLKTSGAPATGSHDLRFQLFAAAAGGLPLATDCVDGVLPDDGLFTVELDFGASPFNGSARWMEIAVRSDATPANCGAGAYTVLTTRQELTPAPYALGVRLPLAETVSSASPAIDIRNTGTGRAAYFQSNNAAANATALRVDTNSADVGVSAIAGVNSGGGYGGYFEITSPANVSPALFCTTVGGGPALRADGTVEIIRPGSALGDVYIGSPTGVAGITGFANNGNRRDIRFGDYGLGLYTNSASGIPVTGQGLTIDQTGRAGIGTTGPGAMLDILTTSASSGNNTARFQAPNIGPNTSHIHYGTRGDWYIRSADPTGKVILQDTGGSVSIGTTSSPAKVTIDSADDTGLWVSSLDNAGPVVNLTSGLNGDFSGNVLNIITVGNANSQAIYAQQTGSGAVGAGDCAVFEISNADSTGEAVEAITNGSGDAVQAINSGMGRAGYFSITGVSNNDPALYCRTSGGGFALWADGPARVDVLEITGADVAEKFPTSESREDVKPGMVMEIDPGQSGKLRISRGAYNRRVAGVVSGAGDIPVGAILGNLPGHQDAPAIALSGRVWVQCDASSGAIEAGDLLTTSETSGHAMKAVDHARAQGAVLGKAMSSLAQGETGLVLVLVNLQ